MFLQAPLHLPPAVCARRESTGPAQVAISYCLKRPEKHSCEIDLLGVVTWLFLRLGSFCDSCAEMRCLQGLLMLTPAASVSLEHSRLSQVGRDDGVSLDFDLLVL